eukprot:CAMPEP_0183415232 /NCGR_PEP_ID=MMETSP0370-20130417/22952_1 /TAXON_ID=268820 /ORGANISM="Peridinium aciculiferum, Strain PAER-2" /LENGTH=99 /DNA_ID=CAMNT_0025598635 /DNA_START=23 /DNA_END=320 /DNA_ORIENTATION=-
MRRPVACGTAAARATDQCRASHQSLGCGAQPITSAVHAEDADCDVGDLHVAVPVRGAVHVPDAGRRRGEDRQGPLQEFRGTGLLELLDACLARLGATPG